MIVQVDGWSGSGKTVLMYLLDGHPEVYAHPFHDLIQNLFRQENWEEDWVKHKDIWELRNRLVRNTQYFKTESFIRQGKYVVEYKAGVQIGFPLHNDFSVLDNSIINELKGLPEWTPEQVVEVFYKYFSAAFHPEMLSQPNIFLTMGGWKGLDSADLYFKLYPKGKRIIVKRNVLDIVAVRTGRRPIEIDYRSNKHNSIKLNGLLNSGLLKGYNEYYKRAARMAAAFPDSVLLIDFEDLFVKRDETLSRICSFIGIADPRKWTSSFLGMPIVYEGVDYADNIFDRGEDVFSKDEQNRIYRATNNQSSNFLKRSMKKLLVKNIGISQKVLKSIENH
jgi:Sulfotransferase family